MPTVRTLCSYIDNKPQEEPIQCDACLVICKSSKCKKPIRLCGGGGGFGTILIIHYFHHEENWKNSPEASAKKKQKNL